MKLFFKFVDRDGPNWGDGTPAADLKARFLYNIERQARVLSGDRITGLLFAGTERLVLFEAASGDIRKAALDFRFRYSLRESDRAEADTVFLVRRAQGDDGKDTGDIFKPSKANNRRIHLVEGMFSDGTPCTPRMTLLRFLLGRTTVAAGASTVPPTPLQTLADGDFSLFGNFVGHALGQVVVIRRVP